MKFSVAAALLTFAASAFAQTTADANGGISVFYPLSGAQWTAGTTQEIKWNILDASLAKKIKSISLRGGASNNLDLAYIITNTEFDASTGKYDWAIDNRTETGAAYSVQVTTESGSSYSPHFTIIGAAPGTTNNTLLGVQPGDAKSSGASSPTGTSSSDAAKESTEEGSAASVKISALVGVAVAGAAVALF
ncbi:hypothetical protein BJV82DRAFT_627195 [Fennellomyces sp. T-0311]|nr:hypothetical protein BJV82DRAFT_627195 [Fennellomyces sp. T-0311]